MSNMIYYWGTSFNPDTREFSRGLNGDEGEFIPAQTTVLPADFDVAGLEHDMWADRLEDTPIWDAALAYLTAHAN